MASKRRKKRILIVDDDDSAREKLRRILIHAGFRVEAAANGLELMSSLNVVRPDLIVLDTDLGWVSGVQLCRLIGRIKEYHDIPVMFVSRQSGDALNERCLDAGAVEFFTKPVNGLALLQRVKHHLGVEPVGDAGTT